MTSDGDLLAVSRLTPEAKLRVLSGMIHQAWTLKEAWLRLRHPEASDAEIRRRAREMVGERSS
ncbi:MAG: hypothetical protein KJO11_08175 [Gemmatimonadetes bacterium]|nr:hypothetical protein [Gemmatimonadota bacterium]MBT8403206.1 hypothetical protein [Gemmatimonadota bacterium]NNK63202.1 hypothetical protein [Gemmatimonadota bacterium]